MMFPMKLHEWMDVNHVTQTDLAGLVGCSVSTINRHIKHGRVLDPKLIRLIYFITLTAVRPDDFYDLESKPPEIAQLMRSAKARELHRAAKRSVLAALNESEAL